MSPAQQHNPNTSITNFANTATIVSGVASIATLIISVISVFIVYKTKLDTLESNLNKVENDVRELNKDLTSIKVQVATTTTAINIKLYGSPSTPVYHNTAP